jgi:hypothetical protein
MENYDCGETDFSYKYYSTDALNLAKILGIKEFIVEGFFDGSYHQKMGDLLKKGFAPLTLEELIKIRTNILSLSSKDFTQYEHHFKKWANSFQTADMVAQLGDRIKLINNPTFIKNLLTREIGFSNEPSYDIDRGDYLITAEEFEQLPYESFKLEDEEYSIETDLAQSVWKILVRKDNFENYRKLLAEHGIPVSMKVWFATNWAKQENRRIMGQKAVIVRPWRLEEIGYGSDIDSMYPVTGDGNLPRLRLIGKADCETLIIHQHEEEEKDKRKNEISSKEKTEVNAKTTNTGQRTIAAQNDWPDPREFLKAKQGKPIKKGPYFSKAIGDTVGFAFMLSLVITGGAVGVGIVAAVVSPWLLLFCFLIGIAISLIIVAIAILCGIISAIRSIPSRSEQASERECILKTHSVFWEKYAAAPCTMIDLFADAEFGNPFLFQKKTKTWWRKLVRELGIIGLPDDSTFSKLLQRWANPELKLRRLWDHEVESTLSLARARYQEELCKVPPQFLKCSECEGTGFHTVIYFVTCENCRGTGSITESVINRYINIWVADYLPPRPVPIYHFYSRKCGWCDGSGRRRCVTVNSDRPCGHCNGTKGSLETETQKALRVGGFIREKIHRQSQNELRARIAKLSHELRVAASDRGQSGYGNS